MPCCASECEAALAALGFGRCRVVAAGAEARVELPPEALARLTDPGVEAAVHAAFRDRGFFYVSIALPGGGFGAPDDGGLVGGLPEDL